MKKTKEELLRTLKNTALIILGTVLIAFGTGIFIIPFELVTGGVSGIGIILKRAFSGIEILNSVSTELYTSLANWVLFFIGLVVLGRSFAAKTLVSAIVYPLALSLTRALTQSGAFGGFFDLSSQAYTEYSEVVLILATIFGGAFIGAGVAVTFLGGGSSGGTDIIALSICKYAKKLKSSVMIFAVDAAVILVGVFAVNNLVISLLGVCSAFICAIAVDKIFLGSSGALCAVIVSDKYEQINDAIIRRLGRTTTSVDAVGGFSGAMKKQIHVTFSMSQYADFTAIMASVDKNAFITVNRAHEINGEGWTYHLDDGNGQGKETDENEKKS